ncbi:MAG: hypothetical protein IJJ78_08675 [Paludibacteraceae bacterium]|nr:hypothetical protein [Paludibacteraceae bacterium]
MLRGKKKFICRDCGEKFSAPDSYDFEDEDIPEVLNMETVEKISFLTKKILGSAVKKNDMSQIHEDMTSLTLCLYETFFYGLEEYSGNALYRKNIVQKFCDIYKMAEASEDLNNQEKCEKPL